MPKVARLSNATLYIYADDHAPPHFHLVGPNSNAQIDIETFQVMRGRYDRRDFAEAVDWASWNQDLLRAMWSDLND